MYASAVYYNDSELYNSFAVLHTTEDYGKKLRQR